MVLISNDVSLASMLETVLPRRESLRVLRSGSELPEPGEFNAETVILDLPPEIRRGACEQIRKRYSGRLLIAVSSERETEGWPPDPACRFLVRPFGGDELSRALEAPVLTKPILKVPDAARRRGSGGRRDPARRRQAQPGASAAPPATWVSAFAPATEVAPSPAAIAKPPVPTPSAIGRAARPPANAAPGPTAAEPAVAAGPGAGPEPEPAPPGHLADRRRRRIMVEALAALVLVVVAGLGGIAIGRSTASADPDQSTPATFPSGVTAAPTSTIPSTTGSTSSVRASVLAAGAPCLSALDRADAAISYLVANIRDDRLSKSMHEYQASRLDCRTRVR